MRPPTHNMLKVLRWLAEGRSSDWGCKTMSDYGGRTCTLRALLKRGLIDGDFRVTEKGRQLL